MKIQITALMIAVLAVAACKTTREPDPRKILLSNDTVISIEVDDQERVELTVKIPAGSPHTGTYTSTSKYLLDDFKDAQLNLGKPGTAAWIEVDGKNEILAMTNRTTMQ